MSKVLNPQKSTTSMPAGSECRGNVSSSTNGYHYANDEDAAVGETDKDSIDFDDFTSSSSILEFLSKERDCSSDQDAESIFQEVNRLADNTDTRSVDELLREAELLLQQQQQSMLEGVSKKLPTAQHNGVARTYFPNKTRNETTIKMNAKYTKKIENVRTVSVGLKYRSPSQNSMPATPSNGNAADGNTFTQFVDNLPSESVLSDESTPKELQTYTATEQHQKHLHSDDTDDGTDTMEEITEGIGTIELLVNRDPAAARVQNTPRHGVARLPAACAPPLLGSPMRRSALNFNATQDCSTSVEQRRNSSARSDYLQTPDSGIGGSSHASASTQTASQVDSQSAPPPLNVKTYRDQATNSSPLHRVSRVTSPIEAISAITREHALKQDIEQLQERLKDTEERLQSLRLQHDSLSQLQRDLRESNTQLQDESEVLKLDVQHLNECANVLRNELQAARHDRNEALELQRTLQSELEDNRQERKRAQCDKEKDTKHIQDLQRQCREMERILMRKHPDSVSALIVASKNSGKLPPTHEQENANSRKLLEQRIAQLEADAKEQDLKAQKILANVQARFNSVQSKYETHIADLETQVLSLQEINTKLNEKIESQVRTLDYFVTKKAEKYYNNCTQTEPCIFAAPSKPSDIITATSYTQTAKANMRNHSTNTIAAANVTGSSSHPHSASSSTSSTANSTPNNSRPNSKQSGLRRPAVMNAGGGGAATASSVGLLGSALTSRLPVSQSDTTIALSSYHAAAKEDAHLLATVRGMRVDLAIKDKAMQRLSRELDECKKTIRKLQKDAHKADKSHGASSSSAASRRNYDATHYAAHDAHQTPASTESQALKEAQNKIKLLEADYKSLHDKRLQDLKTLQSAHERELSSCHETVRILQQRLNERDEAFAVQKRRKVPVDYYALKAKVSSLERRHSEREERLHMLVEALSKGRLNGALEGLLGDNNNQ